MDQQDLGDLARTIIDSNMIWCSERQMSPASLGDAGVLRWEIAWNPTWELKE